MRSAYAQAQTAVLTKTNSDTDYDGDVKFTKAASTTAGPTVEVRNVDIKSQKANQWSDLAGELPWVGKNSLTVANPEDQGSTKNGKLVMKFTYNANLEITGVEFE